MKLQVRSFSYCQLQPWLIIVMILEQPYMVPDMKTMKKGKGKADDSIESFAGGAVSSCSFVSLVDSSLSVECLWVLR